MQQEQMIRASEFCVHYHIEVAFLYSLQDLGLIRMTIVREEPYIDLEELGQIEKMIRLHELDINPEGIDALTAMASRMEALQQEVTVLRNRLRRYEGDR